MKKLLVAAVALLLASGAYASGSAINDNNRTSSAVRRLATTNRTENKTVGNAATDDFGFRLVIYTLERMTDRIKKVESFRDVEEVQNRMEEFAPILTEEQKAYVLTPADKERFKNVTGEFYKYAVPVMMKYTKELEMTSEEILKQASDIFDSIDRATTFGDLYSE